MLYKYRVAAFEEGSKLLSFLNKACKAAPSVKAIKRAIDAGLCRINGRIETFSTHALRSGDLIEITLQIEAKQQTLTLPILYEDEYLLICDKPPGVVSEDKAFHALLPKQGKKLTLIHRLDKQTSGVILLAKTATLKEKMVALFKEHAVVKYYLAVVDGTIKKDKGVINRPLGKLYQYQGQNIWGSLAKGKKASALTEWTCLDRSKEASLLLCSPITGRTHQLRAHLSEEGYPILGDLLYAKKKQKASYHPKRLLLHAVAICFTHPITRENLKIRAPLPLDFLEALQQLKLKKELVTQVSCFG